MKHPTSDRLRALVAVLLEAGGLSSGREAAEAQALWAAALRDAPRMRAPLDEVWLAGLMSQRSTVSKPITRRDELDERRQDWGEAPDVVGFVGRVQELAILRDAVVNDRRHVVAVLGVGGIGKTSFAARLAQDLAPSYRHVYWRSLRDAPPSLDWLAGAIGFLSDQQVVPPDSEVARVGALLQLLRKESNLLVLDNFEILLQPGESEGRYRAGYDGYGRLLQAIGQGRHQSCLVLTSREAPPELVGLGDDAVSRLELSGLGVDDGHLLLADKRLSGNANDWAELIARFDGNGLALKVVAESIRELFGGELGLFLREAGSSTYLGGIRQLLAEQIDRSSSLEQQALRVLAVEREAMTLPDLLAELGPRVGRGAVLEAVGALRRRSLLERTETAGRAAFTLQSVVLEYVTDRLVEEVSDEITSGTPLRLVGQPIIKAQSKDYVRQIQERLIGEPILRRVEATSGRDAADERLRALLDGWRGRPLAEQGFGPGNAVNLLRLLRGNLRGLELSRLAIRQAYLQEVDLQDASLGDVHLSESVLSAAFNHPVSVELSSDGTHLLVGTSTGDLQLWRVADRTLLVSVHAHAGGVWRTALSGDGRLVASAGEDGSVKLWEVPSGRLLTTLEGHAGGAFGVGLSRDGRLVASGGFDAMVKLWDAVSGRLLTTLEGHTDSIYAVAVSPDGRLVASGGEDGTVRLWDTASGRLLAALEGHAATVRGVALSQDGQLLATGSLDATVRLWDTRAGGRLLATLDGHTGGVWHVALSADGQLVASGSLDGTAKLWDANTGRLLMTMVGHTDTISSVALSGGGLVASGGWDGAIRLWEASSGRLLATLLGHAIGVLSVGMSGDSQLVVNGSIDGTVRVWDASSGQLLSTLRGHRGAVWGVAVSGDGHLVASGSWDSTVKVWNPRTGRLLMTLEGHSALVRCVAMTVDGRLVASSSQDGTIKLWETSTGRLVMTVAGDAGGVWCVALSGDGRLLVGGGQDDTVKVWETASGRLLRTLEGHTETVKCVALSGDGRLLASGSWDRTIKLWETAGGRLLTTLRGHSGTVESVALSADGQVVASSSWDGTVKLWDISTQRLLATLSGHSGGVWYVALSADGQLVASGGLDGTVRLWAASAGASLRTLRIDRCYERMDITGLTGVTEAQRATLLALGAIDRG